MKKAVKRIFITLGVVIGLFLLAAVLIPVLFKDKILAIVKKEMNDNLNATTDFKDVDISLFRNFPRLSVGINELKIVGKDDFKGDTLIAAKSIDVALDLMKAIGGSYDILYIGLIDPRIHAIVHENGAANWNITKPDTAAKKTEEASKPFAMKLRKYEVRNGFIEYNDMLGKMHAIIDRIDHTGGGDFGSDAFTLETKTKIEAFTYIMGNIPYLNKVKTTVDLDLQVDSKNSKYSFNTDKIQLNGLKLSTNGFVQMPDTTTMVMDINFKTPSNDFKDILSLVPGIYTANFKDVKTTGSLALNGAVKGKMTKTEMPAFNVNLEIKDGSFQYPALPQKVNNIQVKLAVNNPDGVPDHTLINLEKGHIELGAEPFDFRLLLKTPISNQWIDASLKGKVDLNNIKNFVKLEDGTKMSGIVTADVSFKGSVAAAQKQKYDDLNASGTINVNYMNYVAKDYPDGVSVASLLLTFNPKNVSVANFKGNYLGTNYSGDGSVDNILGYYFHNEALKGTMHFTADQVDLNKFMGTSTTTANPDTTHVSVFLVPDNLDLGMKVEVGKLKYDKLNLTDLRGGLAIRNQVVALQDVFCHGLDGTIKMTGFYGTKTDKKNPDIDFNYSVEGVDVKKTYESVEMVQKMMPSAKYLTGKISSHLNMSAKLGGDMKPIMNSISGKGDLQMLSGLLSGFPMVEQITSKLNLNQYKSLPIKDLKLFYTIANGRIVVEPYKLKIDQIEAEIAGSTGFDQTIKYGINTAIPTSLMGSQGTAMVNNLLNQANAKGLNLKMGDKVNLAINVGGTVTAPKIETNLKNIAGNAVDNIKNEIKAEVQKKVDSVKNVVKDTVKAIKNQAVNAAKDEIKKQIFGDTSKGNNNGAKKAIDDAAEKAKKGLKGLFGK